VPWIDSRGARNCVRVRDPAAHWRSVHVHRPGEHVDANQHAGSLAGATKGASVIGISAPCLTTTGMVWGATSETLEHAAVSRRDHQGRAGNGVRIAEEGVERQLEEGKWVHQELAARHARHRIYHCPLRGSASGRTSSHSGPRMTHSQMKNRHMPT